MTRGQYLLYAVFRIIPTRLLSRIFGALTRIQTPRFLLDRVITWYSRSYGVRDEYRVPPGGFRNFNRFFTRKLREEFLAVDETEGSVVSPVEGRIDQFGKIEKGTLLQAKGIDCKIGELVPFDIATRFENGSFITLYLSPADYHRIHSPVTGEITGYSIVPGRLKTVQDFMVRNDPRLFNGNERINTCISCGGRMVVVCKIGAMNVGTISLSYREGIRTNRFVKRKYEVIFSEDDRIPIKKGNEIGIFNLGSTVICLFEEGFLDFTGIVTSGRVRVGEKIGEIR